MKLDRGLYKKIKRMDREDLQEFLERLYKNGFEDGAESGSNADFRIRLSEVLNNTKGVGTTLYDRIMENAKGEIEK